MASIRASVIYSEIITNMEGCWSCRKLNESNAFLLFNCCYKRDSSNRSLKSGSTSDTLNSGAVND